MMSKRTIKVSIFATEFAKLAGGTAQGSTGQTRSAKWHASVIHVILGQHSRVELTAPLRFLSIQR